MNYFTTIFRGGQFGLKVRHTRTRKVRVHVAIRYKSKQRLLDGTIHGSSAALIVILWMYSANHSFAEPTNRPVCFPWASVWQKYGNTKWKLSNRSQLYDVQANSFSFIWIFSVYYSPKFTIPIVHFWVWVYNVFARLYIAFGIPLGWYFRIVQLIKMN